MVHFDGPANSADIPVMHRKLPSSIPVLFNSISVSLARKERKARSTLLDAKEQKLMYQQELLALMKWLTIIS